MNRWQTTTKPQHIMLPAVAAYAFGTSLRGSDEQNSNPAPREAPTSA